MPTKRTTPTAAPTAKPTTAKEALEAGRQAYEDAASGRFHEPNPLPQVQQEIADLLADIVAHGGSQEVVDGLLLATARHLWHSRLDTGDRDQARTDELRESLATQEVDIWKSQLTIAWLMNRRAEPKEPVARTIIERVRASVIDRLRDGFERFVCCGTPEEHRLMVDVYQDHASGNHGSGLPIAEHFSMEAGNWQAYIAVPEHLRADVEKYLDCQIAAEARALAATGCSESKTLGAIEAA